MRIICNPVNMPYGYQMFRRNQDLDEPVSRSAADPSLVLFKGKYYVFLSGSIGFYVSDDLIEWRFVPSPESLSDFLYGAPDARVCGDYLYIVSSDKENICDYYRSRDPENEPFERISGSFRFVDPNLLFDDDNRVYLYFGCSDDSPLFATELDKETMQPKTDVIETIYADPENRGYERNGDDHVSLGLGPDGGELAPWLEGSWMSKIGGKYYLQYAITGTEYNVYADGVYVSDTPLGPFAPAKNNPFSYKPGGFINAAGHGSTLETKEGTLWHVASMRISHNDKFERRLGLFKVGVDKDGELFCDQRFGDWPVNMDTAPFTYPEWMLLSYGKPAKVSSGSGSEHLTDEDIRTWWTAESAGPDEWAEVDLGAVKDVRAVQINFADDGSMKVGEALKKGQPYTRWILEGSVDGENYFVIKDKHDVETDLPHDLVVAEDGIAARYVRLRTVCSAYGQRICVSGLRVFGNSEGALPEKAVPEYNVDGLDLSLSWNRENADGVNVLFGYAEDKLYHSYMVFGENHKVLRTLVKDQPMYIRLDAFNENGITEGDVIRVF